MELVYYKATKEGGFHSCFDATQNEFETFLDKGVLGVRLGNYDARIKHSDINVLRYLQVKLSHQVAVHKRLDVVEYLSRWLTLREIQELEAVEYFGNSFEANVTSLIMLVALRDEPNKPKHLREPEPPKVSVAQKPRVHKIYKQ